MNAATSIGHLRVEVEAEIRPCREHDLPGLEWMGLFTPHRHIIRETFEAQKRGEALMLLAVAAGFPIAQAWIDLQRKSRRTAKLWAVRTFYPLQGNGIGAQMMRAAERVLRDYGVREAFIDVERGNERALRFYKRLGWRPVSPEDARQNRDPAAREQDMLVLSKWLQPA